MKVRTRAVPPPRAPRKLGTMAAAVLIGLGAHAARAQEATRIVAATVYPDSAGVEH